MLGAAPRKLEGLLFALDAEMIVVGGERSEDELWDVSREECN